MMSILRYAIAVPLVAVLAAGAVGDSIFDQRGLGTDVIPTVGDSKVLAGAVIAARDPLSCSILSPFGAALADKITLGTGFSHMGTKSRSAGEEKRTVTTLFPSATLTVPVNRFALMTGLFVEKQGRLSLTRTDIAYSDEIYDIDYRVESSIHSVPVFASVPLFTSGATRPMLIVSGGILFSFLDIRERTVTDFASNDFYDADDVHDTYATGKSFAGGVLVDLGRVRLAALFRTGTDLDATLESESKYAGIWHTEDLTISSDQAFSGGLWVGPTRYLSLEADYYASPWDHLEFAGTPVTARDVERWSVGVKYRGDHLWRGRKYPLMAGYYRQPLAWESDLIGEITEEFWSLGTSIPIGGDRASITVSVEAGRREAKDTDEVHETIYGFSLSISALEAWHREIRR
jgi:hypothetical protein